jgi:hypothetical protein
MLLLFAKFEIFTIIGISLIMIKTRLSGMRYLLA